MKLRAVAKRSQLSIRTQSLQRFEDSAKSSIQPLLRASSMQQDAPMRADTQTSAARSTARAKANSQQTPNVQEAKEGEGRQKQRK